MKQRILTAMVGVPVILAVLLGPAILAEIFVVIVGFGMIYEFLRLTEHESQFGYTYLTTAMIIAIGLAIGLPAEQLGVIFGIVLLLAGIGFWIMGRPLWITFGPYYIAIPLALLVNLRLIEDGQKWIVVILAATWLTDTMALFAGKAFGRTKLAPTISPNKTREGTATGIISGFAAVLVAGLVLNLMEDHRTTIILAAILLPPLAVIGDLVESKIKRTFGKKDSGAIFPGHGGFLDRVDSLLFTITGLWILVTLFSL